MNLNEKLILVLEYIVNAHGVTTMQEIKNDLPIKEWKTNDDELGAILRHLKDLKYIVFEEREYLDYNGIIRVRKTKTIFYATYQGRDFLLTCHLPTSKKTLRKIDASKYIKVTWKLISENPLISGFIIAVFIICATIYFHSKGKL